MKLLTVSFIIAKLYKNRLANTMRESFRSDMSEISVVVIGKPGCSKLDEEFYLCLLEEIERLVSQTE